MDLETIDFIWEDAAAPEPIVDIEPHIKPFDALKGLMTALLGLAAFYQVIRFTMPEAPMVLHYIQNIYTLYLQKVFDVYRFVNNIQVPSVPMSISPEIRERQISKLNKSSLKLRERIVPAIN